MSSSSIMMTEMLLLLFKVLIVTLLSPRVFSHYIFKLKGASKIDLPLYMFSLTKTIFTSLFSDSTLLASEHSSTKRSNIRRREIIP